MVPPWFTVFAIMPKKGKKGGKKKKAPAFLTDPESCEPFGFLVRLCVQSITG